MTFTPDPATSAAIQRQTAPKDTLEPLTPDVQKFWDDTKAAIKASCAADTARAAKPIEREQQS